MKLKTLTLSTIIAVMTIFVTHVKPSEAGWGYGAAQGTSQYVRGEVSNNDGRKILGIVMFGFAVLGGIVSAANK
ncbi:hypothetical protein [Planktothrix agardhii]|jgi:hypothetical protein|uniref:hypothetical protein n=1 Tax=Planktothrix agardhii TaxID=1160 RepID=UPI001D0A09B0|nr:hypothetical protein [Planktothrix agardhii]MCB8753156.1 hypothetical protein [Planktothrix agardhii 1810]MCF3607796.1 hypothetical protein [Planktothrix agardhii 1033]MCF3609378.1 hypothetical protein [Planktothrix agardhii 1033]MEA5561215.1 hypothetical protein [Planktothrix agardhii UHCC 0887]